MEKQDLTEKSKLEQGDISKEGVETGKVDTPSSDLAVSKPLSQADLQTLDYTNYNTPARMMALGEVLVKSKLVSGKTKEDVVVCLMAGKELGLPFIVSLSQIYPIDGKPSLGVHILKGLILKHKIIFRKLDDAAPMYKYVAILEDGTLDKESIITSTERAAPEGYKRGKTIVGYKTTYEFTREIKMPSGKYRDQIITSSFTTQEAFEAELMEKTNWKRYWRRMLDARAFSTGAREIGDDFINGLMTPDELGANSYIDENGIENISYEEVK